MAGDNKMLGVFQLVGIPPAPRGMPQIEVTFDIDANGIINVSARDKATNNEQKITITSSSGLSKDEVEKMAKDAELHAGDDRKKKEEIESRNRADSMVYNIEKMLKDHRDKVSDADAKQVEAALEDTKKAMQEGGDKRRIHPFLREGLGGATQCPTHPTKTDDHHADCADDDTPEPGFHPLRYLHTRLLNWRRKLFSPSCKTA